VLNADEGHCCFANGTCCVGYTQQGAPVALGCCPAEYRCVVTAGMAAGEHGCAKMDGTLNSIFVSILVVIVFFALVALSAMFLRARRRQRLRRMMEATYDDAYGYGIEGVAVSSSYIARPRSSQYRVGAEEGEGGEEMAVYSAATVEAVREEVQRGQQ